MASDSKWNEALPQVRSCSLTWSYVFLVKTQLGLRWKMLSDGWRNEGNCGQVGTTKGFLLMKKLIHRENRSPQGTWLLLFTVTSHFPESLWIQCRQVLGLKEGSWSVQWLTVCWLKTGQERACRRCWARGGNSFALCWEKKVSSSLWRGALAAWCLRENKSFPDGSEGRWVIGLSGAWRVWGPAGDTPMLRDTLVTFQGVSEGF